MRRRCESRGILTWIEKVVVPRGTAALAPLVAAHAASHAGVGLSGILDVSASAEACVVLRITAAEAIDRIRKQAVTTPAVNEPPQTFTLPANATYTAHDLVVYAQPAPDQSNGLQLRLAWEIQVTDGPVKTVYYDAIADQVIATA